MWVERVLGAGADARDRRCRCGLIRGPELPASGAVGLDEGQARVAQPSRRHGCESALMLDPGQKQSLSLICSHLASLWPGVTIGADTAPIKLSDFSARSESCASIWRGQACTPIHSLGRKSTSLIAATIGPS